MKTSINSVPNYRIFRNLIILVLLISGFTTYSQKNPSQVIFKFVEEESNKKVTIQVFEQDGSDNIPVEELDVFLYVERMFSNLPIGDMFNTTDENGFVEIQFPSDLPGDSIGNLQVILLIEDSEIINDTTIYKSIKWGIPVVFDEQKEKRSLWAAGTNAPLTLLVLVNSLLLAVWIVIIYICYEMYLIKKE